MSIILFIIKLSLMKNSFAMKILDPKCRNPVITKKIRETFLMLRIVFMVIAIIVYQACFSSRLFASIGSDFKFRNYA